MDAYQRLMRSFSLEDLPIQMVHDMACRPGMRVVELGSGPGAVAEAIRREAEGVRYVGIDPDSRMLRYASTRGGPQANWTLGLAQDLPFLTNSVDRVSTTLVLHHLTPQRKRTALAEALRILRPGGKLYATDWTQPLGWRAPLFLIVRFVDGFAPTADHAAGRLPSLISAAGFENLRQLRRRDLWLGTITHFEATKPSMDA